MQARRPIQRRVTIQFEFGLPSPPCEAHTLGEANKQMNARHILTILTLTFLMSVSCRRLPPQNLTAIDITNSAPTGTVEMINTSSYLVEVQVDKVRRTIRPGSSTVFTGLPSVGMAVVNFKIHEGGRSFATGDLITSPVGSQCKIR
jgi:hypothetical protein